MSKYAAIREFIATQLQVIIDTNKAQLDTDCPNALRFTWLALKKANLDGSRLTDKKYSDDDPLSPLQFYTMLNSCMTNYAENKGIFTFMTHPLITQIQSFSNDIVNNHEINKAKQPLLELYIEMRLEELIKKILIEMNTAQEALTVLRRNDESDINQVHNALKNIGINIMGYIKDTKTLIGGLGNPKMLPQIIGSMHEQIIVLESSMVKILEEAHFCVANHSVLLKIQDLAAQIELEKDKAQKELETFKPAADSTTSPTYSIHYFQTMIRKIEASELHVKQYTKEIENQVREIQKSPDMARKAESIMQNAISNCQVVSKILADAKLMQQYTFSAPLTIEEEIKILVEVKGAVSNAQREAERAKEAANQAKNADNMSSVKIFSQQAKTAANAAARYAQDAGAKASDILDRDKKNEARELARQASDFSQNAAEYYEEAKDALNNQNLKNNMDNLKQELQSKELIIQDNRVKIDEFAKWQQGATSFLQLAIYHPEIFAKNRKEIADKLGISEPDHNSLNANPMSFFSAASAASPAGVSSTPTINEIIKKIDFIKYVTRKSDSNPSGTKHEENVYQQRSSAIQFLVAITYDEKANNHYDVLVAKMVIYKLLRLKYSHSIQMVMDEIKKELSAENLKIPSMILDGLKGNVAKDELKTPSNQQLSVSEVSMFYKLYNGTKEFTTPLMRPDEIAKNDFFNLYQHLSAGNKYKPIDYFESVKSNLKSSFVEDLGSAATSRVQEL